MDLELKTAGERGIGLAGRGLAGQGPAGRLALGVALALALAACADGEGGTASGGGSGGGPGAQGGGGSGSEAQGGGSEGGAGGATTASSTSTGTPVDVGTTIEDACEAGCTRVEELSATLGCAETANCVSDCIAFGEQLACTGGQYLALARCSALSASEETCSCGGSAGNLSCNHCSSERSAIGFCPGF